MDNYQILYKGADGWEDWSTTFERNTAVRRRSVVIRGDATDGSPDIEEVHVLVYAASECVINYYTCTWAIVCKFLHNLER